MLGENERRIIKMNKVLLDVQGAFDLRPEAVDGYLDDFRHLFVAFAEKFKNTTSPEERRELMQHMCDLNGLYALQLKTHTDLPKDLIEIAYDFDNPDYPGHDCVSRKILSDSYILLT